MEVFHCTACGPAVCVYVFRWNDILYRTLPLLPFNRFQSLSLSVSPIDSFKIPLHRQSVWYTPQSVCLDFCLLAKSLLQLNDCSPSVSSKPPISLTSYSLLLLYAPNPKEANEKQMFRYHFNLPFLIVLFSTLSRIFTSIRFQMIRCLVWSLSF